MSYLQNKSGTPAFKEAIISFWFRIPQKSMEAIPYDNESEPEPVFNGILPLLVIGQEGHEEEKYDGNPKSTLWMVTDFKSEGPFYDYSAEYIGEVCLEYHDFFFVFPFHCCLEATRTTRYTPIFIGNGEDYHREEYRVVYSPTPHPTQRSNPTCIGVSDDGYLYVNFQTNQEPKIVGDEGWDYVTSITPGENIGTSGNAGYIEGDEITAVHYDGGLLGCVGLASAEIIQPAIVHPGHSGSGHYSAPVEHKTYFPTLAPETGKFFSNSYETNWTNEIKVSPDRWHHVLVSVKLQTTKSHNYNVLGTDYYGYEGGSLLYVALDDKNYTKEDLTSMWSWGGEKGKFGPNEVFPDQCWDIATDGYNPDRHTQITYELEDPEVPAGFIGIPAIDNYVEYIQQVEMAELQIWFGKSFNTGDVKNRRLFISSKGKPVPPEKAEEKLGKPDILLHKSSKWKKGMNTGSLTPKKSAGTGGALPWFDPVPNPDGIVRWKPDPSLYGPQNKNEKEPAPQGET